MEILKIETHSEQELISRLRNVTLLNQPNKKPYEFAEIGIYAENPKYSLPCQRYVLLKQLKTIRQIKEALTKCNIDLLEVGYVTLTTSEGTFDFLPPILQKWTHHPLKLPNQFPFVINDGLHRCFIAKLEYQKLTCVFISNPSSPYYAYPNSWEDIKIIEPGEKMPAFKKWHIQTDYKKLYVDFNSGFDNHVGAPRGDKQ